MVIKLLSLFTIKTMKKFIPINFEISGTQYNSEINNSGKSAKVLY